MNISEKNFQGFTILGMDFDTNYGKKIYACTQFEVFGHEISISTGAAMPSTNNFPVGLSPILVTDLTTGEETYINGSVEEAINFVLQKTAVVPS